MKRVTHRRIGLGVGRRRGAAVVEFAVVLPLLLALLFGIIEFGWVFMIRQTVVNAAREGCRTAVLQTATNDDVGDRIREVMAALGYAEGTDWSFTATDVADEVQNVSVSISLDAISLTGGFIMTGGRDLEGTCTMRKEGIGGAPA